MIQGPHLFISSAEFRWAVAKILVRARKDKKLTQQDVAAVCRVRQSAVAQYESGEMTPSLSVFLRLAALLDLSIKELTGCLRYDVRKADGRTKLAAGSKASCDLRTPVHYREVGVQDDSSASKSME